MARAPAPITKENFKRFLDSFDTVLTDCDGVIWRGDELVGRSNQTLNTLQAMGKKVFYVTNNSTKSRDEYVAKCERLGFKATKESILSSAFVLAQYLKQQDFKKRVYVVGTGGITQELDAVGITHCGPQKEVFESGNILSLANTIKLEPDVGAVAVGFDPFFTFPKILRAASYLDQPGCLFLATNTDERFPVSSKNLVFPGTGCMVRCVETAAERPPVIMGKPSTKMFTVIQEKNNLDPKRTIMIGDRCNTDILFGKNCGLQTLVVLSGVTSQADLDTWAASSDPEHHRLLADYCLTQLDELLPLLEAETQHT
ncbi:glycerol-3-phosphate phosphatase-like isoform X1 [Eriocheir sinensis]|uniref:glycerol-3-phosphate phosphatase-like isoform X1 n=2 Tax=Eriocheir sinensis TaxID=95602 RepID=UPI0021C9AE07|nr:glycerol-3-phosphate phosphatase-like isoform X1 [Eriocheir sinensis]